MSNRMNYDKFSEHNDHTPLGKLQQQYWTTKQQVIKKLGKKEDEFVVMSDSDLDAKLELFEAIEQNSNELLRCIETYQDKLVVLTIEEGDMARFLKSQSSFDNKTRAGKMMAEVGKAQNLAAHQRNGLRSPLVRLYNEVETFRNRAVADTSVTVRRMEKARTEYRSTLLWMRNVSQELDPDATAKLEKFRRVQCQVKKTKSKFDRLKTDVIQKIDMLSASRCNMFSHVLVQYQLALIQFWEKTAKTMNAVSDAFKGQQHYEFNVIKNLNEPKKVLANKSENSDENESVTNKDADAGDIGDDDDDSKLDTLIDLEQTPEGKEEDSQAVSNEKDKQLNIDDELKELIDLMTKSEDSSTSNELININS